MAHQETQTWSQAVQRELDNLQRRIESRFTDFSQRLDNYVTLIEYQADRRTEDLRITNMGEKIEDSEQDIESLKRELRDAYEELRREIQIERQRSEAALAAEAGARQTQHSGYIKARQDQFRWLMSMVMIPLAIAVVDLLATKK